MRMTNKIMQNNSLYNINNNKILQDQLSTQMSMNKKLTRPSDDPIIAIRALRLRTNVSELTQFMEKNAKDANGWMKVTEDALGTTGKIITNMRGLMVKGPNDDQTGETLAIIMEQVKSLRDEIYATGNVDFAGRYVFTGYRTDTSLSFTDDVEDKDLSYKITEQVKIADFDSVNYTDMGDVDGLSKGNYMNYTGANEITEGDVSNGDIHRIRLSYDELKDGLAAGNMPTITYMKDDGTEGTFTFPVTEVSLNATPQNPYQQAMALNNATPPGNGVIYVPETGELLFSDAAYDELTGVVKPETEIRLTYEKDEWQTGDLRPEHYFTCTSVETKTDGSTETIYFNQNLDDFGNQKNPIETVNPDGQKIEYDVGYNQRIAVNTTAGEVFTHSLDRYVDDLDRAVAELQAVETTKSDIENIMKSLSEGTDEYIMVRKQYDAAQKAYSYVKKNVHKMFERAITVVTETQSDLSVADTDIGTRSARLDLISNRLLSQKTTFDTLKSENEDADVAEVAVKLTSAELSYNAALMATGKIMQTSLMNYI